jgi:membrane protein implicated in regulation of membrane protease activity
MIKCPFCGTTHLTFQSNCSNCGAPLPAADEKNSSSEANEILPTPPLAPRPIPNRYAWRLLSRDGGAIAAFVFVILGFVFSLVGAGLTIGVITAFLGIPFLMLGIIFLIAATGLLLWRYQSTQKVVTVLREGQAARGKIVSVGQNYSVRINGRYPWVIQYQFQAVGQEQAGQVTILNQPGEQHQAGRAIWVLYLPDAPKWNSIYPHP